MNLSLAAPLFVKIIIVKRTKKRSKGMEKNYLNTNNSDPKFNPFLRKGEFAATKFL